MEAFFAAKMGSVRLTLDDDVCVHTILFFRLVENVPPPPYVGSQEAEMYRPGLRGSYIDPEAAEQMEIERNTVSTATQVVCISHE